MLNRCAYLAEAGNASGISPYVPPGLTRRPPGVRHPASRPHPRTTRRRACRHLPMGRASRCHGPPWSPRAGHRPSAASSPPCCIPFLNAYLMRTMSGQGPRPQPAGQQQPCRSVALLSRVRTQNGNDQLRAPPTLPCGSAFQARRRWWRRGTAAQGRALGAPACAVVPWAVKNHSRRGVAGGDNAWHAPAGAGGPDCEESEMRGTTASIEKWLLGYSEDVARASGNTQFGDPRPC